jgi:hypothetical protein
MRIDNIRVEVVGVLTILYKVPLVAVQRSLNCLVRHIKLASFNLGGCGIKC